MLTCEEALERMSEALDGPLSLEDRQALDEHLESCPECRAAYEALFQMEDALREIGETPAPAELSAQVMARIRSEQTKSRRPIPLWKQARWRNLAGLAACAVLCVGLYYGADLGNPGESRHLRPVLLRGSTGPAGTRYPGRPAGAGPGIGTGGGRQWHRRLLRP